MFRKKQYKKQYTDPLFAEFNDAKVELRRAYEALSASETGPEIDDAVNRIMQAKSYLGSLFTTAKKRGITAWNTSELKPETRNIA